MFKGRLSNTRIIYFRERGMLICTKADVNALISFSNL